MTEEDLIAQNAQVGVAISNLYPKMSLSGMLGFQSLTFPKLLTHKSYAYSFVPSVSMPIFNWGALRREVEVQKYIEEQRLIDYENILLEAVNDIKTSYLKIDEAVSTDDLNKQSLRKYQDIYDVMRTKYTQGLVSLTQELQAHQELLNALEQEVISENKIYQGIIQFYKAVGG